MSMQAQTEADQILQQAEQAFQSGRLDEAEQMYNRMLSSNVLPGVMHFRLGMIANIRGDFDRALKEHREAFKQDPQLAGKVLPQGSPLRQWGYPGTFDTVEVKECPICKSKKRETLNVVNCMVSNSFNTSIDPIRTWVKCSDCGHGYVTERPSDAALKKIHMDPPPQHLQMWNYALVVIFSDVLHDIHAIVPEGKFLDVGTAAGVMAGLAKDYGYDAVGMDVHPVYRNSVERFGIEFIEGDFCTHKFGKDKFSVVTFGDVLNHMTDPNKAMEQLDKILDKKGIAWISIPTYDCAWTTAVGPNDPMWLESEYIQYFSKASLNKLLKDHGFKIRDYRVSKHYQGSVEVMIERA